MYRHGPSCLRGPVSRSRPWWTTTAAADVPAARRASADDPPLRLDLIARVRAEIAAGAYETPQKWERALQRLLERLG